MKKDEILNMLAGRTMDALIAQEVMGWQWFEYAGHPIACLRPKEKFQYGAIRRDDGTIEYKDGLPHYSTDIADAWKVVEEMERKGYSFSLISDSTHPDGLVIYLAAFRNRYASNGPTIEGFGDTPAFAICRAALLAVMELDPV